MRARVGLGLITLSVIIILQFKKPINNFVKKESQKMVESNEFKTVIRYGDSGNADIDVVNALYDKFSYINTVKNRYFWCFASCLFSGSCLVLAVLLSVFNVPLSVANLIGALYAYGLLSFIYFLYCLIYIVKYSLF